MDTLRLLAPEEVDELVYASIQLEQKAIDDACDVLKQAMLDNGCATWAITSAMREIKQYPTLNYKWRRISFYARSEGAVVALPLWFTREVD